MMEKQAQVSDETASYKEYPPSEIYTTSDPPPAYMKPRQNSIVQVARIAAYTLVAVSFILGFFILATSYVTASLSAPEYQPYPQEYIEDRLPRFQGLVADPLESEETKHHQLESAEHRKDEEAVKDQQTEQTQSKEEQSTDDSKEQQNDEAEQGENEIKFKLPIHLDLDALTGALMEGNSKSKMNCVVEKQKSEEVLNKDQRDLITFGLDLAALDPGLKHVTGERLAIVCETSREAPKENQPNQMVLPFPLPGFHPVQQRFMPQHIPQQMPQQLPHMMMHHQMPQNGIPRMPYQLPFFRPNPFQNVMARQQMPQHIPRRGVEEIPILVLEDEARLQNLVELPRVAHPQIHNLVDFQRVNPQISQIQNIVDLARGAAPALQNLIEIPEHKPFHMHPAVPEARNLPPWARPEVQDQVVQIQALPAMRAPRPQVQVEARPFHVESAAIQVEGRPIQVEGRPIHMEPRPVQMEHRPVQMEHRPVQMEHRPVQMEHRPVQMEHRPIRMEEHRPIQMETRQMQMEVRPESRHPEGRAIPLEGRVLPVPSDTVNPPPLPFEMQEPSRPHWGQWLGGCLSDKSCATQISQVSGQ